MHNTIGSFESIPNASAPYHEDIFTMLEVAYHNHVLSLQGERNAIMKYTDKKPMTSKFIHLQCISSLSQSNFSIHLPLDRVPLSFNKYLKACTEVHELLIEQHKVRPLVSNSCIKYFDTIVCIASIILSYGHLENDFKLCVHVSIHVPLDPAY